jgi:threonine dehydrogenase-like Zn-dependent dehydrogenase
MRILRTNGGGKLQLDTSAVFDSSFVKVKMSLIVPTSTDISLFTGRIATDKPIAPCRMATAVVSEDRDEFGLKRGARVIINPYIQKEGKDELAETEMFGLHEDGFLRDFTALPIDNIIPFPEEVRDHEAVFAELLAVAMTAVNKLSLQKGEYVAIVGGSVLSNVIAQLVAYYQAIPIYISNNVHHNQIAKECGIYYVIDESHENPLARVMNITGGRGAEHTVMHAKSGVTPHFMFSLAGKGADALIVSLNPAVPKTETDVSLICKKNLTVKGVSSGADEFAAAVNMLALKQIDFSHFIDKNVSFDEAPALFDEMSKNEFKYICPAIRV